MSFLVISSSLNSSSKSAILAKQAFKLLKEKQLPANWLDLREVELPMCDGDACYSNPNVAAVGREIKAATCILISVPIYNYASGSAAKNLIELTGRAWTDKTVGFMCAAGGRSSYMSIMSLANSLMLDFRSLIIPRFVYADGSAFTGDQVSDQDLQRRIAEFVDSAIKLDGANMPELSLQQSRITNAAARS